MDDSFQVRVNRLFGSKLFESVPDNSFPATSWSVVDGEVERRTWNRQCGADREDIPCSSAFYDEEGCFSKNHRRERSRDLKKKQFEGDPDEDSDEKDSREGERGVDYGEEGNNLNQEEQEIKSFVGLDPTLDNEDEEDEFDRIALCREDAGKWVYMSHINDHGRYLNCRSVAPGLFEDSFNETIQLHKDFRADHFAATQKLKENKEGTSSTEITKHHDVNLNLKPILKRKGDEVDPKPKKRVRFDESIEVPVPQDIHIVPQSMEASAVEEGASSLPEDLPAIPDYLRNPSKYTHYTFEPSDDEDAEDNKRAFEDFRSLVRASTSVQLQPEFELPVTIAFNPRKKVIDDIMVDDSPKDSREETRRMPTVIAGEEVGDGGSCEMEEDDAETPAVGAVIDKQKNRRYRCRSMEDDST